MNPSHYPKLELCKKLTEIGFPETDLCYGETKKAYIPEKIQIRDWYSVDAEWSVFINIWVCPSVMEMLDEMPAFINVWKSDHFDLKIVKQGKNFCVQYFPAQIFWTDKYLPNRITLVVCETLPNALAEMVLYLHESKYITF